MKMRVQSTYRQLQGINVKKLKEPTAKEGVSQISTETQWAQEYSCMPARNRKSAYKLTFEFKLEENTKDKKRILEMHTTIYPKKGQ